ncbi:hypothetical protein P152DRAFT_466406 [Eremomyces bilateralis CBS 781.70]|uniref:Peroxisome membrane anchor protein Pex14p N-terminal domain-containing protein n=1 Tax=Eremomyces bilateralis CBS 781.70 TaxID=1392243 RepID=A0A6G1G308_9PEZI|nr:uncharacterized protein P152DRAFT_466406 [Eremomyces bilateralis CBS 781.70]KAF1812497.1 hypothetical protein P152DRAFT_466406 [Eremomyces bilateralis CBS 781.70]
MAFSKKDAAGIPSWQRAQPGHSDGEAAVASSPKGDSPEKKTAEVAVGDVDAASAEASLRDQATKFLQDPSIQDASRERKVAFLESKGIPRSDAETLLGPEVQSVEEVVKEADNQPSAPAAKIQTPVAKVETPAVKQSTKDIPPIITYPEFLTHSAKKPPLITANLLWNILYASGTTAAVIYGASKFLVEPLVESLSETRHDFFNHTQEHLTTLNDRLTDTVSTVPAMPLTLKDQVNQLVEADQLSDSSSDSDPTELFHRDIGVQTSPALSRRGSVGPDSLSGLPEAARDAVTDQEAKLQSISDRLQQMIESAKTSKSSNDAMDEQVRDLSSYLTGITYSSPYYGMSGLNTFNYSMNSTAGSGTGKIDAVDAVKADIRGVKGVLLSSRNFPSARAAVR